MFRESIKVYHVNKQPFECGKPTNLVLINGELPEPVSNQALQSATALQAIQRRAEWENFWSNAISLVFLGCLFAMALIACINLMP